MNQDFAAPVIQQPETPKKRKKHFCLATIPFIFIALFSLFSCIHRIILVSEYAGTDGFLAIGDIIYLINHFFDFIGAVLLTVLLFVKVYNASLGIPLLMFSAGNIMRFSAQFVWAFQSDFYETFAQGVLSRLVWILMLFAFALAFLAVAIYVFIVVSRKKPAPKVLWIIPVILFCLLSAPWNICMVIELFSNLFNDLKWFLPWIPSYFSDFLFPVAIILLLIWISFPYKKDKSNKTVQPVPEVVPVMPPVMPAVKPVVEAKSEEEDPERTVDYSYAEAFYSPVNNPADKPDDEVTVEPEEKTAVEPAPVQPAISSDAEKQRTNMQLLKEYKELLDGGVITQEDYNKKKNELLGL